MSLTIVHAVLAFFFFCIPFSISAQLIERYDLSKSWENAIVYVPSNFFPKSVTNVETDAPMPVVILMHGCGGIGDHEKKWADFLKGQGLVVVMPDSFAIPGRAKNCDSSTHTTNVNNVPVNDLRPAEARYALSKLKAQPWADQEKIFLMGHSEGGMAAYLTPELGFKGVIISGFPCTIRGGVRAKPDTPVLAINWENDPWFAKPERAYRQCSQTPRWKKRAHATELILSGSGHATAYESGARDAVSKFLREILR